jgi:hypothetical protein
MCGLKKDVSQNRKDPVGRAKSNDHPARDDFALEHPHAGRSLHELESGAAF